MKSAVSENKYDSRSRVQGGEYMGTGLPPKYGTLRETHQEAVPQKSKEKNTSPKKIG